jgi:predicted PurR-regulated permease PerM
MNTTPTAPLISRAHIFVFAFFAVFLFLLYQMARLLTPFLSPLLWAAILTLALYPLYSRVVVIVRGRNALAAGIMTFITLLAIVGPTIMLLVVLTSQAGDLYQWISSAIQSGRLSEIWGSLSTSTLDKVLAQPALEGFDIKGFVTKGLSDISSGLASQMGAILKNTLLFGVNIGIMLVALFFFFKDGERYYKTIVDLLPFTPQQKITIAQKFADTFSAVINGMFLVAFLQGLMTGIGFALFQVPFPVFWGFLAAILALLPFGGAALVWVPGALFLFLTTSTLQAVLLGIWGLLLVSLPDNFLKPLLIGRKAQISTFLLFITILGGLQVFGILGLLFGPLVLTLLTAFVQIYREEYAGTVSNAPRAEE